LSIFLARGLQLGFFVPPPFFDLQLPQVGAHVHLRLSSVAGRLIADLQQLQVKKTGKIGKFPEFGRDLVARGSSGLKPLRRRAPACQPSQMPN